MSIEIPDRLFQGLLVCGFLMKEEMECTCLVSSNYFGKTPARQPASYDFISLLLPNFYSLLSPELRLFEPREFSCLRMPRAR